MRATTKLILIATFLVLCGGVVNAQDLTSNLVAYHSFDDADTSGTTSIDQSSYGNNGTRNGGVTGATCYVGECYNFTADKVTISDSAELRLTNGGTLSAIIYAYSGGESDAGRIITKNDVSDYSMWYANYVAINWNGFGSSDTSGSVTGNGRWIHAVVVFDNNTQYIFLNGTQFAHNNASSYPPNNANSILIGDRSAGGRGFDGLIDEVAIWNTSLNSSQISTLFTCYQTANDGYDDCIYEAPPSADNSLNFSDTSPSDESQFNTELLNFNMTVNATTNFNCSFLVNGVNNQTRTGFSAGTNVFVGFNLSFTNVTEIDINFSFTCNSSLNSVNATTNNVYIDNIEPDVTGDDELEAGTKIIFEGSNLSASIVFNDTNVFSYNVTINGTQAYNGSELTGNGYNLSFSYDTSAWSAGTYSMWAETCDGHTALKLKKNWGKNVNKKDMSLSYSMGDNGVVVRHKDKTKISDVNSQRHKDRFDFRFKFHSKPKSVETFVVESDSYIHIVKDSEYTAHLITGRQWLDFANDDTNVATINRINDKKVEVNLYGLKNKDITFNSIGELNCDNKTFYFNIMNVTTEHAVRGVVYEVTSFELNVSVNASMVGDANATFYYNNTAYTLEGTLVGNVYVFNQSISLPLLTVDNVNLSFNWSVQVDDLVFNVTSNTQSVHKINMDNCTDYDTIWVNFTILDEDTDAAQNGLLDYNFLIYELGYSTSILGSTNNLTNQHKFCLYPSWANFTTNITIDYMLSTTSFTSRSYTATDTVVDNSTNEVTLFLLGDPTEITIHIVDDADNDLEGILVEAYKFDITTNTETLVESQLTDPEGNALFGLKRGTTRYGFQIYQGGVLRLNTTRFKLFATTYDYVIRSDVVSRLAEWLSIDRGVTRTLNYSNYTNLVHFDWSYSLSTIDQVCLNVTSVNQSWYGNCSNSSTSNLNFTISTVNISYVATAYARTTTGYTYVLESLGIDTWDSWRTMGTNLSLALSFIVLLVFGMLGLGVSDTTTQKGNVVVGMLCAGLVILYLFKLLPLSFGGLVGIITVAVIILIIINKRVMS